MRQEAAGTGKLTEATLRTLLSVDTATLYEAAEGARVLDPSLRPLESGYRFAGPALTVACPPGDNLMLHAAVADARPGEVLVAQCHDASFGVWGEVLMTSAIARGIAGLVLDGGVRDVPAIRAAKFPVFCRSISIPGAGKKRRGLLRQPISCAGALVWPGDIVLADDSGVVVVAAADLDAALAAAMRRQKKEVSMMAALRDSETTLDLLDLRATLQKLADA